MPSPRPRLTIAWTMAAASGAVPDLWVEELLLQSYLFAGFPRTLNAMREWRREHPEPVAPPADGTPEAWRADGERTCAVVYGAFYERLRENIRHLHGALDDWMIVEGYGKVLSRPGLDLVRRILNEAGRHLTPEGGLLCEIGRGRERLEAEFPQLPLLWLDTEDSEGEVFWIGAADL